MVFSRYLWPIHPAGAPKTAAETRWASPCPASSPAPPFSYKAPGAAEKRAESSDAAEATFEARNHRKSMPCVYEHALRRSSCPGIGMIVGSCRDSSDATGAVAVGGCTSAPGPFGALRRWRRAATLYPKGLNHKGYMV